MQIPIARLRSLLRSLTVLFFFVRRDEGISEKQFDAAFDDITDFLGDVNDEKHRITPEGENEDS